LKKQQKNVSHYNQVFKTEFESKIISKITGILSNAVLKVAPPDEATEIELNYHNTTRWKIKFEELTVSYNGNPKEFIESVDSLAILNKKIPAGKYIYFEASKFIANYF